MKTLDDTAQIRVDCFWLTVIVCESELSIVDGAGIESIHCYEQSYFDCNGDWDIQPGDYLGQDFDWWDDEGNTITLDDDEDDEDEDIPLLDDCQLAMFHAGRMIIKYGLDMTVEELVDLVGCNASNFEEKAWEELAIYFSENTSNEEGDYTFEEGVEGLCWNSLALTQIGSHYYVKIAPFEFQLYHAKTNTWVDFSYPSLCMSSSGIDFLNDDPSPQPMSSNNIKKTFTNALEAARLAMLTQANKLGVVPPSAIVRNQFKTSILFNLKLGFSGLPSLNTTATGCFGVPPSPVIWTCN